MNTFYGPGGQPNFHQVREVGFNGEPVPEPLTIMGAGVAIAFGASFKRKLAKKATK